MGVFQTGTAEHPDRAFNKNFTLVFFQFMDIFTARTDRTLIMGKHTRDRVPTRTANTPFVPYHSVFFLSENMPDFP